MAVESDEQEIDYEAELAHQPWWFRWKWRLTEWLRLRRLARLGA